VCAKFLVAGHIAKDVHIKMDKSNNLPKEFEKLFKIIVKIACTIKIYSGKGITIQSN